MRRLRRWFGLRRPAYLLRRFGAVATRYGVTNTRAKRNALGTVELLARYGCQPTFPVPGHVVRRNGAFFRHLEQLGAELALHGYDHVDFRALTPAEAREQIVKAAEAFTRNGVDFAGFRCPYLSFTETLNASIPRGLCRYTSNRPILWDGFSPPSSNGRAVFAALKRFYSSSAAAATVSTPRFIDGIVDIPPSLPDDIQLHDGLGLDPEGVAQAWLAMLRQTYARGEIFVLLFHPELFARCRVGLERLLAEAIRLVPRVWTAPERDVGDWWIERKSFSVERRSHGTGVELEFECSDRATILVRGVATCATAQWFDGYSVLQGRTLHVESDRLPLVGVAADVEDGVREFLVEQGYVLASDEESARCAVLVDRSTVEAAGTEVGLVEYLDRHRGPLVRFWRWPDRARSALCVTGDLDALSLRDYARRVVRF